MDKEETYVVCRLGNDSQLAVEAMRSAGKEGVVKDLVGGLRAWAREVDGSFLIEFGSCVPRFWCCKVSHGQDYQDQPVPSAPSGGGGALAIGYYTSARILNVSSVQEARV